MEMNKTELRKTMYDFNCNSNHLLQSDFRDYSLNLRRYIEFIKNTPVIFDFVQTCGKCTLNLEQEISEVNTMNRYVFSTGDTSSEEIINVYSILEYISSHKIDVLPGIAYGYGSSTSYQDMIDAFNKRFVSILIDGIERYLTKIGIEMGLDDNTVFNISNINGQVIVAEGSNVVASNNVGIDASQLQEIIDAVSRSAESLSENERKAVKESLETISEESTKQNPKRFMLNTAITTLKGIKGSAEFGAAIATLWQFISPLINH